MKKRMTHDEDYGHGKQSRLCTERGGFCVFHILLDDQAAFHGPSQNEGHIPMPVHARLCGQGVEVL